MRLLLFCLVVFASCRSSSRSEDQPKPATPPAPAPVAPTPAATPTAALDVGSMAPDFALPGSDGKVHRLADDRGKRAVIVAWFPKAFTGG